METNRIKRTETGKINVKYELKKSQVKKIMPTKAKFWQKHFVLNKSPAIQANERAQYKRKIFVQRKVQKFMHIMKLKNM